MATSALRAQKKVLRTSILSARQLISSESIQSQCTLTGTSLAANAGVVESTCAQALMRHIAERITNALTAMPEFKSSRSISCFLSMEGEVDTSAIVNEILAQGSWIS